MTNKPERDVVDLDCRRFQDLLEREIADDVEHTVADQAFLDRHGANCDECAAFLEMITSLASFEPAQDPAADAAIRRAVETRFSRRRPRRFLGVAIAASALLIFGISAFTFLATQRGSEAGIQFELAKGRLQIESSEIGTGQHFSFGNSIAVPIQKDALMHTHGSLFVAAETDSQMKMVKATPTEITLRLEQGRLALHLLPNSGVRLKVEVPDGVVNVTGTVFIVEVRGKKSNVSVVNGRVAVIDNKRRSGRDHEVVAGLSYAFGNREASKRAKNPDDNLLILLGIPDAPEATVAAAQIPDLSGLAKGSLGEPSPEIQAAAASVAAQTGERPALKSLIHSASACRAKRDWQCAVKNYEALVRHYPNRPDSTTALVPMGQILLDNLGRPEAALKYFKRYRNARPSGGALGQEALWGECNALAKLKRSRDEKACLTSYLKRYPGATFSSVARSRLENILQK